MVASEIGPKQATSPEQCRGARAMLGWSKERLAEASRVPVRTITRFETGDAAPRASTLFAIRTALEAAGVEFIAENGGGAGVRLRAKG
jgi:transcriptional regulator with XRE-family HTH domain